MSRSATNHRVSSTRISVWVTVLLALGAASEVAWMAMALSPDDIEALESPLVLSVARQLEAGPSGLYGPYDRLNPLVIIHAPLYYRLAALAAYPLYSAGCDSITAALVAGRLLSSLGFLGTLVAVYRLAVVDGLPLRAGWWAVLLVAATPVYGGLQFEVRPDMLGIALQTTGIVLVSRACG